MVLAPEHPLVGALTADAWPDGTDPRWTGGATTPAEAVREFRDRLGTVAIEDMKRGVHVHLPFGEGDMDVAGVLDALHAVAFPGLVCVELSRESHRADLMIPQALQVLNACRFPKPDA